jgi:tetrahydromethanopterin S-methyltransferase subunit E
MADTKLRKECNECGKEFYTKDTKCPYCGSTNIKTYQNVGGGSVDLKGSLTIEHKVQLSGIALTILGLFLTLWATIFFGLCSLNAITWWINIFIALGIVALLFVIIWWRSYEIIKLLRWLEDKFRGKKTYHVN